MLENINLFDQVSPSKPADRLFFALFPDEEAIPQIVKTTQQLRDAHEAMDELQVIA